MLATTLPNEAKQLVRGAVGSAASAVNKELKANAPKRFGRLRKAFFVKRNRGTPTQVSADVRARPQGFYWRFLDKGTKTITATRFAERVIERMAANLPKLFRKEVGARLEKLRMKKVK
jgi:HK97 gp10 family phage protein